MATGKRGPESFCCSSFLRALPGQTSPSNRGDHGYQAAYRQVDPLVSVFLPAKVASPATRRRHDQEWVISDISVSFQRRLVAVPVQNPNQVEHTATQPANWHPGLLSWGAGAAMDTRRNGSTLRSDSGRSPSARVTTPLSQTGLSVDWRRYCGWRNADISGDGRVNCDRERLMTYSRIEKQPPTSCLTHDRDRVGSSARLARSKRVRCPLEVSLMRIMDRSRPLPPIWCLVPRAFLYLT